MILRFPRVLALAAAGLALAATPARSQAPQEQVTLQPGDAVRVVIWREPELSGDFPVDERGAVTLPLLGVRRVTHLPMAQVRDSLMAGYLRQLRNSSINITPLRRVNVLGEVLRPGILSVDPTITLAEVVALAGGTTPSGDLRRIRIVRKGNVILERVTADARLSSFDIRSEDQIFVGRRGWLDRNSGLLLSTLVSAAASLVASLIIAS
jgi:polysaccharide export outer membrane protein